MYKHRTSIIVHFGLVEAVITGIWIHKHQTHPELYSYYLYFRF